MWVGTEARSGATGGVKYIGQIQPWSEFARWPWPRYSQELLTLGSAWKGLCWYFTSGVSVYPEHYYKISKEALNLNPWCGSHSFCFLLPSGSQWWRAELGSPAERCTLLPRSEYLCSLLQERMCHVSRRGWVGGGGWGWAKVFGNNSPVLFFNNNYFSWLNVSSVPNSELSKGVCIYHLTEWSQLNEVPPDYLHPIKLCPF